MKACGFRVILFAIKLAQRISLGESRISLQSNRTRQRRIKLRNFLMRSYVNALFFLALHIIIRRDLAAFSGATLGHPLCTESAANDVRSYLPILLIIVKKSIDATNHLAAVGGRISHIIKRKNTTDFSFWEYRLFREKTPPQS